MTTSASTPFAAAAELGLQLRQHVRQLEDQQRDLILAFEGSSIADRTRIAELQRGITAADQAADSLFQLLNVSSTWVEDPQATVALQRFQHPDLIASLGQFTHAGDSQRSGVGGAGICPRCSQFYRSGRFHPYPSSSRTTADWNNVAVCGLCTSQLEQLDADNHADLQAVEPLDSPYLVCGRCGHQLTVEQQLDSCENCHAPMSQLRYFADPDEAGDFADDVIATGGRP